MLTQRDKQSHTKYTKNADQKRAVTGNVVSRAEVLKQYKKVKTVL